MRQLRDVIARRRPMPSGQEAGPETTAEDVPDFRTIAEPLRDRKAAPASEPADAVAPTAPEAAIMPEAPPAPDEKKQIWDLERDDEDETVAPAARPPRARTPRARPDAKPAAPDILVEKLGAAARPSGGRVKTRILGFHADDIVTDPLAGAAQQKAATDHFPAGWLVVVDGPGRGASFSVRAGVSTVGRDPEQTISLDFGDMSVSRDNHASVAYDEEQNKFFLGHGGKSNIVRRNGNPVLATEELGDGDLIRIGKTTLRFAALCGPDFAWNETEQSEDNGEEGDGHDA